MTEMQIDELLREIEASCEEACAENPDVNPDDVYHEVSNSVLATADPAVRREVRARLGF